MNQLNLRWIVKAAVIVLLCSPVVVADGFQLGGFAKSFFVVDHVPEIDIAYNGEITFPPTALVTNRLRVNLQSSLSKRASLHLSYDLAPQVRDRTLETYGLGAIGRYDITGGYRIDDIDHQVYPSRGDAIGNFWIEQNLDRAFVSIHTTPADIIIGRQAIAFGSARIINPTDVIAPFTYETLDTEDRLGVDAIRIRKPIGLLGEFDVGYLPGYDVEFKNGAVFCRLKLYIERSDVTGIAAIFQDNLMVGLDIARAVGGASVWLEASHVWIDKFAKPKPDPRQDYFRLSIGADYSFTSDLYGLIEYHYNGAGENDPTRYGDVAVSKAVEEGKVFFFGKHYVIPGATYQFTPLIVGSAQVLTNLSDLSFYFAPTIEYSIAENVYLAGGAYVGIGESTELNPVEGRPLVFRSEFGFYPDIYYTSFRVYF